MSDVFDAAKRSQVMSSIRGRGNRSTEMKLAAAFRERGLSGWRRHVLLKPRLARADQETDERQRRVSVRPDFLFRKQRVAVFVDGCFWHGCPLHCKRPAANAEFWDRKLTGNVRRDERTTRAIEAAGWIALRVWEHELSKPDEVVERVIAVLAGAA